MKIGIITAGVLPVPPTSGGAVENLVYTLINENDKAENPIDIDIYSIPYSVKAGYSVNQKNCNYIIDNNNSIINKVMNNKYIKRIFKHSQYLKFLCENLRNKSYDYIIIENRPQYVLPIKSVNSSKIILHMHNDHMINDKVNNGKVAKECEKIIVVSKYIKNQLVENLDINSDKIQVLNNGIDAKRFDKDDLKAEEKTKIREGFGIKDSDFVILFSGRVIREKGVSELVRAVKRLNEIDNLKLVIAGSSWYGSNRKNDFINEVEKESLEIKDKIIFTGYIDYNAISNIYSIADIIVLPSMWDDPFPLTVLESMSMGIPVISTLSGGIPEMFGNEEGILLKRDENIIENLVDSIKYLYNNPELRENIGNKARKKVKKKFTINKFYDRFIEILNENN